MTENLNENNNSGPLSEYERISFEDKLVSEKKKKLLIAIILTLCIIIITISIFLIFYFLNRPNEKELVICPQGILIKLMIQPRKYAKNAQWIITKNVMVLN